MSEILSVRGLCKRYPGFALKDVSFSLEEGYIMGFIGRNGAGKTTTIKSMLNMIRPDAGEIRFFGHDLCENEMETRCRIGVVPGAADYYPTKTLSAIADVTRRFYPEWDAKRFENCLRRFHLDPAKRVNQLSQGMRVKFSIALALSHNARLLIMDEPTSGLDPVSRDELLEIFQTLIEDGSHSILFSTHITSDLEKCADDIVYIRSGKIVSALPKDEFLQKNAQNGETLEQAMLRMEREATA